MFKYLLYFIILILIQKIMAVLVGKKAPDFSAPAVINGCEIVNALQF